MKALRLPSAGLAPLLAAPVGALAALSGDLLFFVLGTAFAIWAMAVSTRAPAMAFAALYCVLYISVGGAYFGLVGYFPGRDAAGDFLFLALSTIVVGYACLLMGYLVTMKLAGVATLSPQPSLQNAQWITSKQNVLALVCLVIFAPEWLGVSISGRGEGGFEQILRHALDFRFVILGYYFVVAIHNRAAQSVLGALLLALYVAIPMSTSHMSGWSAIFVFAALLASVYFVTSRRSALAYLAKRPPLLILGAVTLSAFLYMALLWQGGLKDEWRHMVYAGEAGATIPERFSNFAANAERTAATLDAEYALESLSARMSSGAGYFSLVLRNFADGARHTSGDILGMAAGNVAPRVLFPDKPVVDSDSWLVRQYAGLNVAGQEEGTSIGLGFLAEFYIEFGFLGVVLGAFGLGALLALSHAAMRWAAENAAVADTGFAVLLFSHALVYDASIIKLGAGVIHKTVMFVALFVFLRVMFQRGARHPVRRQAA